MDSSVFIQRTALSIRAILDLNVFLSALCVSAVDSLVAALLRCVASWLRALRDLQFGCTILKAKWYHSFPRTGEKRILAPFI
jgi:hypothetical protein